MSAKEAYKMVKKYTDDKIVLSVAKSYLKKNKKINWIKELFGIEVAQKFKVDIHKTRNGRFYRESETVFSFTAGLLFKKTFKIRLAV